MQLLEGVGGPVFVSGAEGISYQDRDRGGPGLCFLGFSCQNEVKTEICPVSSRGAWWGAVSPTVSVQVFMANLDDT